MSEIVKQINDIMERIHELHQQYDKAEEDFSTIYEEFDDEKTESYSLIRKVEELLFSNKEEALNYLQQASALDFCMIIGQTRFYFQDVKMYPALKEIWKRNRPKKQNEDYDDVLEYIVFDEMRCKDGTEEN